MSASDQDARIADIVAQLRSAMKLLNEAGALQSAAHVATAILCIPAPVATATADPAPTPAEPAAWRPTPGLVASEETGSWRSTWADERVF
jgi:hypothetical protein